MLKVSKILTAYKPSKAEKDMKRQIIEEGSLPKFCSLYSRFWKVDPHYHGLPADEFTPADPCWLWIGEHDKDGYGELRWGAAKADDAGKLKWNIDTHIVQKGVLKGTETNRQPYINVHRLAWQIHNKELLPKVDMKDPARWEIDHKCGVRSCFNPDHLEKVPHTRNYELIKIREAYHMSRPADEQQKRQQAKFMAEMYVQETMLENEELAIEAKLTKKFSEPLMAKKEELGRKRERLEELKKNFDPSKYTDEVLLPGSLKGQSPADEDEESDALGMSEEDAEEAKLHLSKTSYDLIRKLEAAGWQEQRQRGSHMTFEKPGHPHHITIVHPKKDESIGVVHSVEKEISCARQDSLK